jgi:hypothetical protein
LIQVFIDFDHRIQYNDRVNLIHPYTISLSPMGRVLRFEPLAQDFGLSPKPERSTEFGPKALSND